MKKQDDKLFLFELVERGSRIIIYGCGVYGRSYLAQIERTGWCEVVAVADKRAIQGLSYRQIAIEEIAKEAEVDYVIIAIENNAIASEIYYSLVKKGIEGKRILNLNMRYDIFPLNENLVAQKTLMDEDYKLKIAINDGSGGVGDGLFTMIFLKKIVEIVGDKADIYVYMSHVDFFKKFDLIEEENIYPFSERHDNFDLILDMHGMVLVRKFQRDLVRKCSEKLFHYCEDSFVFCRQSFKNQINNFRITKYALLRNRNRIEQMDLHGILGISRYDTLKIPMLPNVDEILCKFNLQGKKYIVINRDTVYADDSHPKLWKIEYYNKLMRKIRKKYLNISIVILGKTEDERLTEYADSDLSGATTLEESCIILKYAELLISSEGGLVHLNHFLGGRSMVFFGPTDVKVFGYRENINLYTEECLERCAWVTDTWMERCMLGDLEPRCMVSITPEMAMNEFERYMGSVER